MSTHDRRYCKAPGCISPIPSEEETHAQVKALKGRAGEPLISHAFGVCSPECWERWDASEDLQRMRRWLRSAQR